MDIPKAAISCLLALALACTSTINRSQKPTGSSYFVARVVSVSWHEQTRLIECLQENEVPRWEADRAAGLVEEVMVFQTTSVRSGGARLPDWNTLVLFRLASRSRVAQVGLLTHLKETSACETKSDARLVQVQVFYPTPNSYHRERTTGVTRGTEAFELPYIVEYIAVHNNPKTLAEYRDTMAKFNGPAVGDLVAKGLFFNFIALETDIASGEAALPNWNQLHIRGFYPASGPRPPEMDAALRQRHPKGYGFAEIFDRLNQIREKLREDQARLVLALP